MTGMIPPPVFRAVCIVFCCAFISAQLSFRLRQSTTVEMIENDRAILAGRATLPEFQNRILAPAAFAAVKTLSGGLLGDLQVWKAIRLLSALIAFAIVYMCAARLSGNSEGRALAACALLAYAYAWTAMMHQWELSSDFLDMAFIALMVFFSTLDRVAAVFMVAILAAFNRESAAFAGIILATQAWSRTDVSRNRIAWGALCTAAALILVDVIRWLLSGQHTQRQMLGLLVTVREWRWLLLPYGAGTSGIAMFLPLALLLKRQTHSWTPTQRGLVIAAAVVAAITCVFGSVGELRVLLPVYVVLLFVFVLEPDNDGNTHPEHTVARQSISAASV